MEDPVTDCGFLPFHSPDAGDEEIAQVTEPIKSGWPTTGPKVKQGAGGQRSEVRGQRSEVRGQRSEPQSCRASVGSRQRTGGSSKQKAVGSGPLPAVGQSTHGRGSGKDREDHTIDCSRKRKAVRGGALPPATLCCQRGCQALQWEHLDPIYPTMS